MITTHKNPVITQAIERAADLLVLLRALEHLPPEKPALRNDLVAALPAMLDDTIQALQALRQWVAP